MISFTYAWPLKSEYTPQLNFCPSILLHLDQNYMLLGLQPKWPWLGNHSPGVPPDWGTVPFWNVSVAPCAYTVGLIHHPEGNFLSTYVPFPTPYVLWQHIVSFLSIFLERNTAPDTPELDLHGLFFSNLRPNMPDFSICPSPRKNRNLWPNPPWKGLRGNSLHSQ